MSNIKGSNCKSYPPEFRIMVVEDILQNNLSLTEACRKYKLFSKGDGLKCHGEISGGTVTMVSRWKNIYLKEGKEAMFLHRSGRPMVRGSTKTKFNSKDELIKENQRLHMEIDYLKKLNSLVQQRMQHRPKSHK